MHGLVHTVHFCGMQPHAVRVEVSLSPGAPSFSVVGLADKTVLEAKERVRAALHTLGVVFPARKILVNLAPADTHKAGSHYDLPIALALLIAFGVVDSDVFENYIAMGELGLDGTLRNADGMLGGALWALETNKGFIAPQDAMKEVVWSANPRILGPQTLNALVQHGLGQCALPFVTLSDIPEEERTISQLHMQNIDFRDVIGQQSAKRAAEIAAVGGHHLLMIGAPGVGKSMIARRLMTILPDLTPSQALEVTRIHSLSERHQPGLIRHRPFRDPHHSASMVSLVGGGLHAKPGEVSLAHEGVLFLDEWPEFSRQALEALREPLETHNITISRAHSHVTYPARFQLVAAMNPCRCGYADDVERSCGKVPLCVQRYQEKLSGPLIDRVDLVVELSSPHRRLFNNQNESTYDAATSSRNPEESSAAIYQRVQKASAFRHNRLRQQNVLNKDDLAPKARQILEKAYHKMRLSERKRQSVKRVARTIADMHFSPIIERYHVLEALSFAERRTK